MENGACRIRPSMFAYMVLGSQRLRRECACITMSPVSTLILARTSLMCRKCMHPPHLEPYAIVWPNSDAINFLLQVKENT